MAVVKEISRAGVDHPGVSCAFMCHDSDGRILLHRRGAGCRDEQGTWDSGAGQLEFGETFEQALVREVREEYGVEPSSSRLLGVRNVLRAHEGEKTHWVALVFAVLVEPEQVRICEPHKMAELGWFTIDALPSPLHSQLAPQIQTCREAGVF